MSERTNNSHYSETHSSIERINMTHVAIIMIALGVYYLLKSTFISKKK